MITLEGVAVRLGAVRALDGVDLEVAAGERLAVTGPSGSGKTTLLRAVVGLVPLEAGTVRVGGRVVSSPEGREPPWRRGVAMAFQRPALWPHLSVKANVAWAMSAVGREEARRRAAALLERLGLGALAGRRPHELSGGEARRTGIARALAASAPVLLLDEPFAGLDPALRALVAEVVLEEAAGRGATVLAAVHDLEAARSLCTRVVRLEAGRLVGAAETGP